MMEVRLLLVLVLALTLTGSDAQIDVCGVAPLNSLTRIVGGDNATEGAWPWHVIVQNTSVFCGGSLITDQWVLTSASCVPSNSSSPDLIVILGTNTLDPLSNTSIILSVSKVVVHPNYNWATRNHNIALLQLSSPVNFTDYIRPVCLAAEDSVIGEGTTMWTTGWGYLGIDVSLPPYWLRQVTLPVVSNQECDNIYPHEVTDDILCAEVQEGRALCNADVGGALVLKTDSQWVQAGVLSFLSQDHCAQGKIPIGFARVSHYQQWISSVTGSDQPGFVPAGSPGLAPVTRLLGAALALSFVLVHS